MDCIERVQVYAYKRFMCAPLCSCNAAVVEDCARYQMYIHSYKRCLKFWRESERQRKRNKEIELYWKTTLCTLVLQLLTLTIYVHHTIPINQSVFIVFKSYVHCISSCRLHLKTITTLLGAWNKKGKLTLCMYGIYILQMRFLLNYQPFVEQRCIYRYDMFKHSTG